MSARSDALTAIAASAVADGLVCDHDRVIAMYDALDRHGIPGSVVADPSGPHVHGIAPVAPLRPSGPGSDPAWDAVVASAALMGCDPEVLLWHHAGTTRAVVLDDPGGYLSENPGGPALASDDPDRFVAVPVDRHLVPLMVGEALRSGGRAAADAVVAALAADQRRNPLAGQLIDAAEAALAAAVALHADIFSDLLTPAAVARRLHHLETAPGHADDREF